jgi:hypothetical protein
MTGARCRYDGVIHFPEAIAMHDVTRREFSQAALSTLLTTSLLQSLFAHDAFGEKIKPITEAWLKEVNQLCADVKDQKVKQVDWQAQLENLFKKVELQEMLALVDFERLTKDIQFQDEGERAVHGDFPKVEGLPGLAFGHQIFALKKDRSVVPHGHNNMATAFFILKGEFRGRNYDRLEDQKSHWIVKPTVDRTFGVAETSTISDFKDNVHWFTALSDTAFIFNIHVFGVTPGGKSAERVYIDPVGEKIDGGLIRAKVLKPGEAYKKYG